MLSNRPFSTPQNKAQLVLAALIVLFAAALMAPAAASAATYTVNSIGDQPDEAPGTGGCKTSLNNCTLRAAIEEANTSTGIADEIVFSALFNGSGTSTIALGSGLPTIEDETLTINGISSGLCDTQAGRKGPCAGVSGPSGGTAFETEGEATVIKGLAVTGATTAIKAISGASGFVARENWIGLNLAGATAANGSGISAAVGDTSASILGNEIVSGAGGTGIATDGASVENNIITKGVNGIHTSGSLGGSFISGNQVKEAEGAGMLIENDINAIVGNQISASGAAGIRVHSAGGRAATKNKIGAVSFTPVVHDPNENTISGSNGPAIELNTVELDGAEPTANIVFNNNGSGNAGLFIDLKALNGGETTGPNNGILPPVISTATSTGASGTAEPEVTVRVYRKASAATGEVESFLGGTTSDSSGNWSLTYSAAIPGGTQIGATQQPEEIEEGTSELAFKATTLLAPTVTGLNPTHGAAAGGNLVTIMGTEFNGATGVKFGATAATEVTVVNPTTITAKAPAGSAGTTVDVTVTNPTGTSPTTGTGNDYGYDAAPSCATDPSLCPPSGGGSSGGGGGSTPPPVTSPAPSPKPLTCKKGFKKKKVGGKAKCVKVKKAKKGRH